MLYLAVIWLDERNRPIGDRPLLFYSFALLVVGIQLLSLGILAELVTAYNIRAEDTYSIAETIPAQETRPVPSRDADGEALEYENHECKTGNASAPDKGCKERTKWSLTRGRRSSRPLRRQPRF